jgi:CDP-glucose 4,6-dehydratase
VLVTGHTGFKGAWLSLWLARLGARVVGYALAPPTQPSLFDSAHLVNLVQHVEGDVRDRARLNAVLAEHQPEIVFHLAAQPLVRLSYQFPVETYETNVMGTANLLEAVRQTASVRACVVVTSDKCYENQEWPYAYRENDAMGGFDPYSSSKGCQELVVSAFRNSFFQGGAAIASARAGNVIGGGDWAADRIVPDAVRAWYADKPLVLRNPQAIRPWQHVLEPLSGYMWLGARLFDAPASFAEAWNFGPAATSNVTVSALIERLHAGWGGGHWELDGKTAHPHEAHFLKLDATKAANALGWYPVWDLEATARVTAEWYAGYRAGDRFDARQATLAQIERYEAEASARGLAWATSAARC